MHYGICNGSVEIRGEENMINEVGRVRGDGMGHACHACKRSDVSHGINCIN